MTLDAMILAVQTELRVTRDGKPGVETWEAIYRRVVPATGRTVEPPVLTGGTVVDARSEKTIATLLPKVQPYARSLVQRAAGLGITLKVISGLRSYAEQDALYAQGRSAPGPKVTNARGGYSSHNFGIAFDVGVFEGSKYIPESPKYDAVAALGQELGLEWGGSWKSIVDKPHWQLRPGWAEGMAESVMLAEMRASVKRGEGLF